MQCKRSGFSVMRLSCLLALQTAVCLALFLLLPDISPAETTPPADRESSAFRKEGTSKLSEHFTLGAKVERLWNSHTSYEFGNPEPPYQAPLSRLEFPLDAWWGGVTLRLNSSRFSGGVEVLTNAFGDTDGRMKDTDWENENNVATETTYGVTRCRLETSYKARADVDMEIGDWLGLPSWFSLRPVGGVRYQHFRLVAHDGVQYDLWQGGPAVYIPQSAIRFKQTYWQYFIGVRSDIDIGRYIGVSDLRVAAQFDWAYVEGANEDTHLLRNSGKRFTYEDTFGQAWYASISLKKGLTKNLAVFVELNYLRIDTAGSHRWLVRAQNVDQSWGNGVKVWSEQMGTSLTLCYSF
jgi:outer membrane protease